MFSTIRSWSPSCLAATLVATLVAACSVPTVDFSSGDGGGDGPAALALVVTPAQVTVVEGQQVTFDVGLNQAPTGRVDVALVSSDGNRLGVMPATLAFDVDSWETARPVTVTGKQDLDTEHETVSIAMTSGIGDLDVAVMIQDDDVLRIVATPIGGLDVTEGQTAPLTVRLGSQPTGPVRVTVSPSDTSVVLASPAELRFDVDDWNRDQTVAVSGQDDLDDASDDGVVTLSAPDLGDVAVAVHVTDDDRLAIVPSLANLGSITEGGTATFTVKLNRSPSASVEVGLVSADLTVAGVSPGTLTFTTLTWNTAQTVTVTLPQDDDAVPDATTLRLGAPSPIETRIIAVAVVDDDDQDILATPSPLALVEGGTGSLAVRLEFRPTADVTLAVASLDTAVATAMPPMLTFTAANFDQPQAVTVVAAHDDGASNGTTRLHLASVLDTLARDVNINVTDDDQLLIVPSTSQVTLTEIGTATFEVRLKAMPSADTRVNVSSGDATAASVSPPTLDFTAATWNTPQTVTVTGVHDNDLAAEVVTLTLAAATMPPVPPIPPATVTAAVGDIDDQTVLVTPSSLSVNEGGSGTVNVRLGFVPAATTSVTFSSSDPGAAAVVGTGTLQFTPMNYATGLPLTIAGVEDLDPDDETVMITASGAAASTIGVTINDDDPLGLETDATTLTVGEAGMSTLRVRLTAQPPAAVTAMVTSTDIGAATVSVGMLTFTTANWGTYQDVLIRGVDDLDPADESLAIAVVAAGFTTRTVAVTVTDDDPQGILLSATAVPLTEIGSATFTVRLAAMPPAGVTVMMTSGSIAHATVTPASLSFTPASFATTQTVTIHGVRDADLVSDGVAIEVTAPDMPARTVTATVTDVDVQRVEILQTGTITLDEGGSGAVNVRLAQMPAGSVLVTLTSGHASLGRSPPTLTFDAGNYGTYQPVTLTGLQDLDAANVTTTVTATLPAPGLPATVNVVVVDDDLLAIETQWTSLAIPEGGSISVGVRLTAQPTAITTVTVTSSDDGAATALPATLSFDPSNWNTYKPVTVAGIHDDDINDEGVTVTLSNPEIGSSSLGMVVDDDDRVAIVPAITAMTIDENASGGFTLSLSNQPNAAVTVSLVSSDPGALTVSGSVSFTTADWSTAKQVAIDAVADVDAANESVTITLSSPGLLDRTVAITVVDDDLALSDLSAQMGPAAGGTVLTATGAGFTAATTIALGGRALTGATVASSTQLTGTTQSGSRWVDAVATKGAVTATVPRAFYHGEWEPATTGLWGGSVYSIVAAGASAAYASTAGGVFRSTDGGATWAAASAGLVMDGGVTEIAADPQNAQRLYVATGGGVYVTTNGATSWARAGTLSQGVNCVAVAPSNPSTVIACGTAAIYRSTDSGATWTTVSGFDYGSHVAFSTQDANVAFLSSQGGVYKTINGGASWSQVSSAFAFHVAVDPLDAAIAYVATASGLLKTTNGGTSWSLAGNGLPASPWAVAIHPTTPSTIYAATYVGVYRSTDRGGAWTAASTGMPAVDIRAIVLRPTNPSELYAGALAWGVFRSTNGASSWTRSSTGLAAYLTKCVAPHPTISGTVFVAVEGMGLWRSTDHGVSWSSSTTGFPATPAVQTPVSIAYRPGTPSTMYVGMYGSAEISSLYKSTDSGASWSEAAAGLAAQTAVYGLAVDPTAPATVYAATSNGVYRSTDAAVTWSAASVGLSFPQASSIGWAAGALYVRSGTELYRSTDGATSWSSSGTGLPAWIGSVVADPTSTTVYVQAATETYRSTDAGASWSRVADSTNAIAIDPSRPATVYLAGATTAVGTRRSLTALATVGGFGNALPPSPYTAVAGVDRTGATVYVGTFGRGLWRVSN